MVHGIQSVLMAGTPLERRLEFSVMLLATAAHTPVEALPFIIISHCSLFYIRFSTYRLWSRQ